MMLSFLHFQYLRNRKYNPTVVIQDIMTQLFPSQLAERKQIHDAEMAELSKYAALNSIDCFIIYH